MSRKIVGQPLSHADLVVVGAGMCGVSFARHAAEAGKRVVLLDSGSIGSGMTGSSAGHVMTGFLPSPAEMISKVGAVETLRLQRWSHESKLALRRRWIDLGLRDTITDGYLLVARSGDESEVLDGIASYWRDELGISGVRVVRGAELSKYISSTIISSALYDPSAFTIDPPLLVEGLRRLVRHPHISVQEETRVERLVRVGDHYRIETTRGEIIAESVGICTGGRALDLVPDLTNAVRPTPTLIAISEPIPTEILRSALPGSISGSDCSHHPDYWTVLKDGRLLFGCSARAATLSAEEARDILHVRMARLFPTLSNFVKSTPTVAMVDCTSTELPLVEDLAPGLHVAIGFSGIGLAAGYGAGNRTSVPPLRNPAISAVHHVPFVLFWP
jgi:gamma-glutamylputrescine oxidase